MKTAPASAILMLLLLLTPLSGVKVATTEGNIVILVSNNPADLAAAHDLKLMIGDNATIIKTSWGTYDPDVVQEIERANPSLVIIIGGGAAVPEQYQENLENDGYTVIRLAGDNQYDTFQTVINWATENGYKYTGEVYIVDGGNYGEILTLINEGHFVIIDRDNMCISEKLIEEIGAKQAAIDQNLQKVQEKLQNKVQVKTFTKEQLMEQILSRLRVETTSNDETLKTIALMKFNLIMKLQKEGKISLALQMQAGDDMVQISANAAQMDEIREKNKYMMQYHEIMKKLNDKTQYRETLEEIKELIKEGKYNEAAELMQKLENQTTDNRSTMTSTTTTSQTMTAAATGTMSQPMSTTTCTETGRG